MIWLRHSFTAAHLFSPFGTHDSARHSAADDRRRRNLHLARERTGRRNLLPLHETPSSQPLLPSSPARNRRRRRGPKRRCGSVGANNHSPYNGLPEHIHNLDFPTYSNCGNLFFILFAPFRHPIARCLPSVSRAFSAVQTRSKLAFERQCSDSAPTVLRQCSDAIATEERRNRDVATQYFASLSLCAAQEKHAVGGMKKNTLRVCIFFVF